jgi:hypothetical protein
MVSGFCYLSLIFSVHYATVREILGPFPSSSRVRSLYREKPEYFKRTTFKAQVDGNFMHILDESTTEIGDTYDLDTLTTTKFMGGYPEQKAQLDYLQAFRDETILLKDLDMEETAMLSYLELGQKDIVIGSDAVGSNQSRLKDLRSKHGNKRVRLVPTEVPDYIIKMYNLHGLKEIKVEDFLRITNTEKIYASSTVGLLTLKHPKAYSTFLTLDKLKMFKDSKVKFDIYHFIRPLTAAKFMMINGDYMNFPGKIKILHEIWTSDIRNVVDIESKLSEEEVYLRSPNFYNTIEDMVIILKTPPSTPVEFSEPQEFDLFIKPDEPKINNLCDEDDVFSSKFIPKIGANRGGKKKPSNIFSNRPIKTEVNPFLESNHVGIQEAASSESVSLTEADMKKIEDLKKLFNNPVQKNKVVESVIPHSVFEEPLQSTSRGNVTQTPVIVSKPMTYSSIVNLAQTSSNIRPNLKINQIDPRSLIQMNVSSMFTKKLTNLMQEANYQEVVSQSESFLERSEDVQVNILKASALEHLGRLSEAKSDIMYALSQMQKGGTTKASLTACIALAGKIAFGLKDYDNMNEVMSLAKASRSEELIQKLEEIFNSKK